MLNLVLLLILSSVITQKHFWQAQSRRSLIDVPLKSWLALISELPYGVRSNSDRLIFNSGWCWPQETYRSSALITFVFAVIKYSDEGNLKQKEFNLVHSWKGTGHHGGWSQGFWNVWPEKENDDCQCSACFVLCILSRTQAHGMLLPITKWIFSSHLTNIISQKYSWKLVHILSSWQLRLPAQQ